MIQLAFLADSCNANTPEKMGQKFGMVHWDEHHIDVVLSSANASGRDVMRVGSRKKREIERGGGKIGVGRPPRNVAPLLI